MTAATPLPRPDGRPEGHAEGRPRRRAPRRTARRAAVVALATLTALLALLGTPRPDPPSPSGDAAAALAADARPGWRAPIPGARPDDVRRAFAAPLKPWGRGHRGVDLDAGLGVVLAPAAGVVWFSGVVVDRPVVTIRHADGFTTSMEPVLTELPVGTPVLPGQPVGVVDPASAHCTPACLHWGVRREDGWRVGGALFDRYVDPTWLIGWSGPSVLWPQHAPRPPGVPAAAALGRTRPS